MPHFRLIVSWQSWEVVTSVVVGGPTKIPGVAGRFHGNPVSRNKPCKRSLPSTVTLKEIQSRNFLPELLPTMNHFL